MTIHLRIIISDACNPFITFLISIEQQIPREFSEILRQVIRRSIKFLYEITNAHCQLCLLRGRRISTWRKKLEEERNDSLGSGALFKVADRMIHPNTFRHRGTARKQWLHPHTF